MKVKKTVLSFLLGLSAFSAYFTFSETIWFMAGSLWAIANLFFLKQFLYELLLKNPKNFLKLSLLVIVKFPILYGLGFWMLYSQGGSAWSLLAGFSFILILSMQKKLWNISQNCEKVELA